MKLTSAQRRALLTWPDAGRRPIGRGGLSLGTFRWLAAHGLAERVPVAGLKLGDAKLTAAGWGAADELRAPKPVGRVAGAEGWPGLLVEAAQAAGVLPSDGPAVRRPPRPTEPSCQWFLAQIGGDLTLVRVDHWGPDPAPAQRRLEKFCAKNHLELQVLEWCGWGPDPGLVLDRPAKPER